MGFTPYKSGTVVALGNFDGLHIGHMAVINAAKEMAEKNGAKPCALIFTEHPLSVLTEKAPVTLFTENIRNEILNEIGVEVCNLDFKSLMNMTPEMFFDKIVVEMMGAVGVCCGFNYSFGKRGAGTPELLRSLCEARGIEFYMASETDYRGEPVSSTRIRAAIEKGDIEDANEMLGRAFTYRQLVVDGDKRGRLFGTPTINQYLPSELVEPKHGVYMSKTVVDGNEYYSVTNIGVRPTVGTGPVSSETYILDFAGDLYGKYVNVALLRYIRPERKFSSVEELMDQIKRDAETVREWAK